MIRLSGGISEWNAASMVASRLGFINKSNHTYENLYDENVYLQFNSQDKQQDADRIKKKTLWNERLKACIICN